MANKSHQSIPVSAKTEKLNSLAQRYSACEEAVVLLGIMQETNRLLTKKLHKVYPEEHQDQELITSVKVIERDLIAIKKEIQDLAIELAEDSKEIKEDKCPTI